MFAPRSVHQRTPLDRVAIGHNPQEFIGGRCIPKVPVSKLSDSYYIYGAEHRRRENTKYEPSKAKPQIVSAALSTDNYTAQDYGLRALVTEREIKEADSAIDPRQDAVELTTELVKLDREVRAVSLLTTAGNYATGNKATLAGSDQFDHASSDPIAIVKDACNDTRKRGAMKPNCAVINSDIMLTFETHPLFRELLKYTDPLLREEKIAALLGLQKIFVGTAMQNTADEGLTEVLAELWPDSMALMYLPPQVLAATGDESPNMVIGRKTPTFCAEFTYFNFQVDSVPRSEVPDNDEWVWVRHSADMKIPGSSFAYLLSDCLSI